MTSDISTSGYSTVTISFSWLCAGNTAITPSFGQVQYSTNSGGNWTTITSPRTNYNGQPTWTTVSISSSSVPAIANQATLRLRFVWTSSGYGSNPAFAVDDLLITGGGSVCANVGGNSSANPTSICSGQTSVLSLTGSNGAIQWQQSANGTSGWVNVTGGSGATTASYTTAALTTTTYYRAVLSAPSCPDATSSVTGVTVNPSVTPALTISASPSDTFCAGSTLTFTAGSLVGGGTSPTFQWKVNNNNAGTGNPFSPSSLNNSDVVTCEMTSNANCATSSSAVSNSVTVVERALPAVPTITQSNDTLESSPATAYQWYRNNGMIPGGNNQKLTITQDGVYEVEITDAFGCKRKSASLNVIGTALNQKGMEQQAIHFYPNPNNGSFVIEYMDDATKDIQVSDATGRIVYSGKISGKRNDISLNSVASGVYFLHVKQGGSQQTLLLSVVR